MERMRQRVNLGLQIFALSLALVETSVTSDNKRPFYIIGHQVNSIGQIEDFLDKGSRVLESDVQFFPNGSVKEMYHGLPCECILKNCFLKGNLAEHLKYIRNITDPRKPNSYYEKMLVQFLDMKLGASNNKTFSGREIARHVLDYLWTEDGSRKQEVRVLLYLKELDYFDVVTGFFDEFKDRGKEDMLGNIGFDGGTGNLSEIRTRFQKLGITKNIWFGGGNKDCTNEIQPYTRLKKVLAIRNSEDGFIDKVYANTIDQKKNMRKRLKLRVDGITTNRPDRLLEILQEPAFVNYFRPANINDDPFAKFGGK